jgi:hypothetical protein
VTISFKDEKELKGKEVSRRGERERGLRGVKKI